MKMSLVTLVIVLWSVGTLAEYGTNINHFGSGGQDNIKSAVRGSSSAKQQAKSSKHLRDFHDFGGAQTKLAGSGHHYNGQADDVGQKSAKAAESGKKAQQKYSKQDTKYDRVSKQIADAVRDHGYGSAAQGRYDNLDNNRAVGYDAAAANKKAFNRGKVFNDNISYGFDKKFNQDLNERGGFEEENGHTAHKVDEYREKQKARKLLKGQHTAANAREDAQHALKESKFNQNAAQKQAANGKFGNNDKRLDKSGATQDAQAVQYDRKDSKFQAQDKGHQQAVKRAGEFANKDNAFGRHALAERAGGQAHGDKKYHAGLVGQGLGTAGHSGAHGGHGSSIGTGIGAGSHVQGNGGQANHKYGESAKQADQGKEHFLQKAGTSDAARKEYNQAQHKGEFDQLKSLKDQRNGKFAQGVHNAENNGFNTKNNQAAKTASGADKKFADAAAQSKAKAAKTDLDEAAFDKENFKRNQQDRSENFKKLKRFYHDKKSGGNNLERLHYNRKRLENEFGQTQAAQKEKKNQFDKAHTSSKHNTAARQDNHHEGKKLSKALSLNNANRLTGGHSNNNAHAFNKAAQQSHGHKKNIGESQFAQRKDNLSKKERKHYDNAVGSAAANAKAVQKSGAEEGIRNGNGGGLQGTLLTNAAHRPASTGVVLSGHSSGHASGVHSAPALQNHRRPEQHGRSSFSSFTPMDQFDQGYGSRRTLGGIGSINSGHGQINNGHINNGHSASGNSLNHNSGGYNGQFDTFGRGNDNGFGTFGTSFGSSKSGVNNGYGSFGTSFGSSFGSPTSFGSFAQPHFQDGHNNNNRY